MNVHVLALKMALDSDRVKTSTDSLTPDLKPENRFFFVICYDYNAGSKYSNMAAHRGHLPTVRLPQAFKAVENSMAAYSLDDTHSKGRPAISTSRIEWD